MEKFQGFSSITKNHGQPPLMRRRILIVTNSFPNPQRPQWGIFIGETAFHLNKFYDLEVVKPIPFFPKSSSASRFGDWRVYSKLPRRWSWRGITVFFPRYFVLPRISQAFHAAEVASILLWHIKKQSRHSPYNLIHSHYLYPEGVASAIVGKMLGLPVVVSARGSDLNIEATHFFKRSQIRWALRNVDGCTAVSKALLTKLRGLGGTGITAYFVPNGVDKKAFRLRNKAAVRRSLGLSNEDKIVLFVGNLKEIKGIRFLLMAVRNMVRKQVPNLKLIIVGDGPLRSEVKRFILAKRLESRVRIVGIRPHHEIPLWMAASDILCLPSLDEGQPNVVLEALSCGIPVAASAVGGIPEIVNDGNGMLFEPGDEVEIEKKLIDALAKEWRPVELRSSVSKYTWSNIAHRYCRIYEQILSSKVSSQAKF